MKIISAAGVPDLPAILDANGGLGDPSRRTARDEGMEQRPKLELTGSRLFTAWLAQARASLAFTTYQAGKLFLIGLKSDGRLSTYCPISR